MTEDEGTADSNQDTLDADSRPGRLGLSPNLWRLAAVMGISQLSIAMWKWEFGIFLEGFLKPWQIGFVFSIATFAGLIASVVSGYIADFVGRRYTIILGFVPVIIGLFTLSYFPLWPLIAMQYGLVWFGISTSRLMSRAIPADEIAADEGLNPARRLMMVMMPLWFVDALGPIIGSFLLSSGYGSGDLHFLAAIASVVACISTFFLIRESLSSEVIEKAREGPKIAVRDLGREFWLLTVAMIGFLFAWNTSIPFLGNLSIGPWAVDTVTYGLTWSLFSLTSAIIMYPASLAADRNLKGALVAGVVGNAFILFWFSVGSGALMLYVINFTWAIPFVLWIGAERSILVLVVSEETKGRALGTYDLLMGITGMTAQFFGAIVWELTLSLRVVYSVAGAIALVTSLLLLAVLRRIDLPKND